jgi:hypothetical protein
MQLYDDDAEWVWEPTGQLDEDGEEVGDYVLSGSRPLTPFEAMVLAAAGAQF